MYFKYKYKIHFQNVFQIQTTKYKMYMYFKYVFFVIRKRWVSSPESCHTANTLHWWKEHTVHYLHLTRLARKFLATPASLVYMERLTCQYGNIFEEKGARLLPTTGEKLFVSSSCFEVFELTLSLYKLLPLFKLRLAICL